MEKVLGIKAVLRVKVTADVVAVGGASVTLTVESGSTTSGLEVVGVVGEDGDSEVLESSRVAEGDVVTGRVDSSGEDAVCVLTAGELVVILVVGPVCGGDSVETVVFGGAVAADVTAS